LNGEKILSSDKLEGRWSVLEKGKEPKKYILHTRFPNGAISANHKIIKKLAEGKHREKDKE